MMFPVDVNKERSGLTLIELVVSLFILSLVALITIEAYHGGLSVWERQQKDGALEESIRALVTTLKGQVRSAYPWLLHQDSREVLYFEGKKDSLELATLMGLTSRQDAGRIHIIRYSLEDTDEGQKNLLIEEFAWPRRDFAEGEEAVFSDRLAGIVDFRLAYLIEETSVVENEDTTADVEDTGENWLDSWSGEEDTGRSSIVEFPSAVEVNLAFKKGEEGREEISFQVPFWIDWREKLKR